MLEQDRKDLEIFSRNEITEHYIYLRLAAREKDAHNRAVLEAIAADEKRHYELIKEESGVAARTAGGLYGIPYWLKRWG